MWKCLSSSPPFPFFLAVLGCQAILVSNRNKSFRRGSVGQPLSSTKSSRIRSQRPLSLQPAGLGEIYCEERKKVVISWHFHDETWPKLCWLGGLEAHKECGCVWPSPSQSHHHWLTHHHRPSRIISPSAGHAGLTPTLRDERGSVQMGGDLVGHRQISHSDLQTHSRPTGICPEARVSSVRNRHRRSSNRQDVFCIQDIKGAEVNEKLPDLSPSCSV